MTLSAEQIEHLAGSGYVAVPDLFEDRDLAPVIVELEAWVEQRARELHARSHLDDLCEDEPFERRYARLYAQSPWMGAGLDFHLIRGPALFGLARNARLLDAVESIIGPEILLNPIHHLRAKLPQPLVHEAVETYFNVPWHQDSGVMWEEADPVPVVGVWIPLVDATRHNGCMELMPGVATGGHLPHQAEGGTTIVAEKLPRVPAVTVECPRGGAVFQDKFTPHRSTPNRSDGVRWSIDLRFQPAGMPTGRPFHPAFVVRSRAHPEDEVVDHAVWARRWKTVLADLEQSPPPRAHRLAR